MNEHRALYGYCMPLGPINSQVSASIGNECEDVVADEGVAMAGVLGMNTVNSGWISGSWVAPSHRGNVENLHGSVHFNPHLQTSHRCSCRWKNRLDKNGGFDKLARASAVYRRLAVWRRDWWWSKAILHSWIQDKKCGEMQLLPLSTAWGLGSLLQGNQEHLRGGTTESQSGCAKDFGDEPSIDAVDRLKQQLGQGVEILSERQNVAKQQAIWVGRNPLIVALLSLALSMHLASPGFAVDGVLANEVPSDNQAQLQGTKPTMQSSQVLIHASVSAPTLAFVTEPIKWDPGDFLMHTASSAGFMNSFISTPNSQAILSSGFKGGEIFQFANSGCVCEETYGILPCSVSVGGNLFLMVVYGFLLLIAAKLISDGSELLLEVMDPGLLGGLLLPILGAFPDSLLILVSGTGGSVQQAQEEVMVGVGVLAGSSVMLLTVAWAGSLLAGRCDLSGPSGTASDLTLTQGLDLFGTGVTTDEQTRVGAWIMMVSTLPFIFAQLPLLPGHFAEGSQAALAGCLVASLGLLTYCTYQVASPWLQEKLIEEARLQFFRSRVLQRISSFSANTMHRPKLLLQGKTRGLSSELIKDLFVTFDKNKDGKIEQEELRGLIISLGLEEAGYVPAENQVETWLHEFDVNVDGTLSEQEFVTGITKWAQRVARESRSRKVQLISSLGASDPDFWASKSNEAKEVLELLEAETGNSREGPEVNDTVEPNELDSKKIYKKAAVYLAAGAAIAAVFADPVVGSIGGFSAASGIPPFFVAFVVTPLASNASELFSSITFARKQRKRNISLTFSQVYGAITMNNTLCLAIFLGLVYLRGLTWDFSSEVTVILVCTFAVGLLAGSRSTFPTWTAIPVLALYPMAVAGVAVLDNVLGWH